MEQKDGNWWVENIKSHGLSVVEELYIEWRKDFILFTNTYQASRQDVLDAYQDAIIIFYENILNGKLTKLHSSPKTYLFSVGKYTLLNKLKANNKVVNFEMEDIKLPEVSSPSDELTERQERMYQALKKLGESCRELIQLFYFQRLSIRQIVQQTSLKNENTVKAQKSRCIKTLREKMSHS